VCNGVISGCDSAVGVQNELSLAFSKKIIDREVLVGEFRPILSCEVSGVLHSEVSLTLCCFVSLCNFRSEKLFLRLYYPVFGEDKGRIGLISYPRNYTTRFIVSEVIESRIWLKGLSNRCK
jgi:hypothetical protein